jgi:ribosomal-protein-alanine N-acetyltransferase
MMTLSSKRVYLRKFTDQDSDLIYKWGQNPRYQQLAGFEKVESRQQAQQFCRQYQQRPYSFLICLKTNHAAIGLVELYERGLDKRSGLGQSKSLGFLLEQQYEGQGLMTEALHIVFDYAFSELGQTEIWANTFDGNERSQQLLLHLGFKYMYAVDYHKISPLFSYIDKYYLLKKADWIKM